MAIAAGDGGLDDTLLPHGETSHIGPDLIDDARELVAKRDRNGFVSAGMRCCRREGWTAQILVKIGAADAYVRRCDLINLSVCYFANILNICKVWVWSEAYSDFSRAAFGLSHIILNSDILLAIVSCCAHICPVELEFPFLVVLSQSLSVVITLLMNAHSIMADIRLLYYGKRV